MRIGIAIDTFNLGGAETMVLGLADLLKQAGHHPVLIHFGNPYITQHANVQNIEEHIIPNKKLYKKTVLLPFFALKTIKFVRQLKLDHLHTHLFGPIIAFAPITKMIRLGHTGTLHDVYTIEEKPSRISLLKFAYNIFSVQLVAVSKPMKNFYEQAAGFCDETITYLPNFSRVNPYLNERQYVRQELGLQDNQIAILSVGRLVSLKRFDRLIEALALIEDNKHIKVFIIGDGPERSMLNNLIQKNQLTENISLLGERNDVERLLVAADIFSLTSETEGMSKSILEALSAGLPIIATNVGGNQDLVINEHNGILLDEHSPAYIAKSIENLASNHERRRKYGQQSSELLNSTYNPERFLQSHIDLYTQNNILN